MVKEMPMFLKTRYTIHRVVLVSVASGTGWAAVALLLGRPMAHIIWGGIVLAPLIGLAAGFASRYFPARGIVRRSVFSLASLYVAAALFGVGMGAYDLWTGPNFAQGSQRIPSAVVIQAMLATLWGLTFTGYVFILWPLSYANHSLVSKIWRLDISASREAGS
jgi:hypothetical protein